MTYCSGFATGPTGGINVVVSIMRFSSAAEAKAVATKDALAGQIQDGKVAIVAEAVAAEPIYWASSKATGLYVIFKGEKVVSLVVSGEKPPAAHKSRMREPALRIATKA